MGGGGGPTGDLPASPPACAAGPAAYACGMTTGCAEHSVGLPRDPPQYGNPASFQSVCGLQRPGLGGGVVLPAMLLFLRGMPG